MNSNFFKTNAQAIFLTMVGCVVGVTIGAYGSGNPTLLGILIGTASASIGNFFSFMRERYVWEREQEIKALEAQEAKVKARIDMLRASFVAAMTNISILLSMQDNPVSEENGELTIQSDRDYFEKMSDSVIQLLINSDSASTSDIRNVQRYISSLAGKWRDGDERWKLFDLRGCVMKIFEEDSSTKFQENSVTESISMGGAKILRFIMSDAFILEMGIKGVDLQKKYSFAVGINQISEPQRALLLRQHLQTGQEIPSEMELFMPSFDKNGNREGVRPWEANVDPRGLQTGTTQETIKNIMAAWQADVESALEGAKTGTHT